VKVLALDISTKTGWAIFEDGKPVSWGTLFPDKELKDFGSYPASYVKWARHLTNRLCSEIVYPFRSANAQEEFAVVIEETNASRQNYSQKILEYLHFCICEYFDKCEIVPIYVRTGEWRRATESKMSKEEKALNAKIARIKKKTGKKLAKIDGKVVGKKGRKHVALRVVHEIFGIELKRKEEDAADALLLGLGYLRGAPHCDGSVNGGKIKKEKV
jgi:hypothetical protein